MESLLPSNTPAVASEGDVSPVGSAEFACGDSVSIIRGCLQGLEGRVHSAESGMLLLEVDQAGIRYHVRVPLHLVAPSSADD